VTAALRDDESDLDVEPEEQMDDEVRIIYKRVINSSNYSMNRVEAGFWRQC
jgi:hypothetical protein